MIDAVLLNGTVGAGKSTTAAALSDLLGAAGVRHAVIDTDWIRMLRPAPTGDPFQHAIAVTNLEDLVRNFRAAGAVRFVIAGVVETTAERDDIKAALAPLQALVCRLEAAPDRLADRLTARHSDPRERRWHLDRAPQLAEILGAADLDDLVVDTTDASPEDTAQRIAQKAGWSAGGSGV